MSTTPTKEDKTLEDDPLGIGIDSSKLYISIGACVCLVLLCIIGFIFVLKSKSSNNEAIDVDTVVSVGSIPTHYTIEFKYADGVNPYNNFSIPPFVPKPPEFFGK
jgi:hypothetical protein